MIWKRWGRSTPADATEVGAVANEPDTTQALPPAVDSISMAAASPTEAANLLDRRPAFLDRLWLEDMDRPPGDSLPRFSSNASDDVEIATRDQDVVRRRIALREALGASQPVIGRDHFAGRHDALRQLISAIEQQRLHVVVYGERGIGKTSLSHVFAETAREARYLVLYGSCGTEAKFDTMFRSFAARIPRLYHKSVLPNSAEAERGDNLNMLLPDDFGPRELAELFSDVVGTRVIIILDEYDRVLDVSFRRDVAELIKNLSDRAARVQLVLTGVAQNLDELIGYAPSIRRNIVGLPMRPMNAGEVRELLGIGERAADIVYDNDATRLITTIAGGSPYLVRLISHQAGMVALDNAADTVSEDHAKSAVERVLTDWNASLPRRVQANLSRDEARSQWPLLIAGARAGSSADGFFTVDDVINEMGGARIATTIERDLRHFAGPNDLLELVEGGTGERGNEVRFRFRFPGVSALLLMSAAMAKLTL